MAMVREMSLARSPQRLSQYGDINIGPLSIKDIKLRVNTAIGGYTMDLSRTAPKSPGGILNLLKPNAILYIGGTDFTPAMAYSIDPITKTIKEVNPSILDKPTTIDKILQIGIVPILVGLVGSGYVLYKIMRRG